MTSAATTEPSTVDTPTATPDAASDGPLRRDTTILLKPGDVWHTTVTGFCFMVDLRETSAVISKRGQEFTLTEQMIESNTDRLGFSFTSVIHDPDAQIARWGQSVAAPGPWPAGKLTTLPGTVDHDDARHAARDVAYQIADPAARRAALAKVEADYGPAGPTSRTLQTISSPAERQKRHEREAQEQLGSNSERDAT